MGVERDGARERIVCDGCGKRTNWYDNRRLNATQVMDVNNISRIVEKGSPLYVCEPCQFKARAGAALAAGAVLGAANVDLEKVIQSLEQRKGPGPDKPEPDDIPIDERKGAVMRGDKPLAGQRVHVNKDMPHDARDAVEKVAEAAGAELTDDPDDADEQYDDDDDLWGSIGDAMAKAIREEKGEEEPVEEDVVEPHPDDEWKADFESAIESGEELPHPEIPEPDPSDVEHQLEDADEVFGRLGDLFGFVDDEGDEDDE